MHCERKVHHEFSLVNSMMFPDYCQDVQVITWHLNVGKQKKKFKESIKSYITACY